MKKKKDREIQSRNELLHCVKIGFSSTYGNVRYALWNGLVVKGEVLTDYSQVDFLRATRMTPENNLVVIRLIDVLIGERGTSFLILYDREDKQVLVKWSLVKN